MKIISQRKWPVNILYWFIVPIIGIVCYKILLTQTQHNGQTFLGYTDTQENQLKLDISAYVDKIHVTQGQTVKRGDILVDLSKVEMDKDLRSIDLEIGSLNEKRGITIIEYQAQIDKMNSETAQKTALLNEEIKVEESKLQYAKSILNPTVASQAQDQASNPILARIAALKSEIVTVKSAAQKLLVSYQNLIDAETKKRADVNLLIDRKSYIIQEKNKLKIVAPFDGIIGNINIKAHEYVDRQHDLISFYEQNPSKAVGYIHESLSLSVNIGDSVTLKSTLHPGQIIKGKVVGKGYRIVEIPERLRKIPQYKTYGMEIFIELPTPNSLFQKEIIQIITK
jgi:multidrug resistance efflux pump